MLRPAEFVHPHLTVNVTPYQIINNPTDTPEPGDSNGGVFHRGQLVWTRNIPHEVSPDVSADTSRDLSQETSGETHWFVTGLRAAVGYVDGLGHVLIDPRVLRPADTPTSNS